jgi:hypothetical protein
VCVRFSFQGPSGTYRVVRFLKLGTRTLVVGCCPVNQKESVSEKNFGCRSAGRNCFREGLWSRLAVLRGPRCGCRGALARGEGVYLSCPRRATPFQLFRRFLFWSAVRRGFPQRDRKLRHFRVARANPGIEKATAETVLRLIHRFTAQECGRTRDSDSVGTPQRCQGGGI